MPRPTDEQLKQINKFTQKELESDQVYVFTSLSADTNPVKRFGWFGEYSIIMSSKMLDDLKKSYQTGVGLLASHNNDRLPFGRTFGADVKVDHVNGDPVETLYVDHYVVTHTYDDEGNKVPLRTEVNGMTTQDIVNHIEVGHTFDTSIGFAIEEPLCSICKNDIRDYAECSHLPGMEYDVQIGEETEKVRCNIIADGGEGLENSLVYAGAVDRAIIQNNRFSKEPSKSKDNLQEDVKSVDSTLYNVDEIKTLPLGSTLYCRMSKGNLQLYTDTDVRLEINPDKEGEEKTRGSEGYMPVENTTQLQAENLKDMVSLEEYNKVVSDKESLTKDVETYQNRITELEGKVGTLEEELATANETVGELKVKSELADKFTEDLIDETVKAGVKARGNAFNKDCYEKYARTLSVDELKEELSAFEEEFSGGINEARATSNDIDEDANTETVEMSASEIRQLAAKNAMERFQKEGGNLEALTKEELSKLQAK